MTNPMKSGRSVSFSRSASYETTNRTVCQPITKVVAAKKEFSEPIKIDFTTIDWDGIKEQSERIQDHFQKGGKPEELSEIKFIKPFSL